MTINLAFAGTVADPLLSIEYLVLNPNPMAAKFWKPFVKSKGELNEPEDTLETAISKLLEIIMKNESSEPYIAIHCGPHLPYVKRIWGNSNLAAAPMNIGSCYDTDEYGTPTYLAELMSDSNHSVYFFNGDITLAKDYHHLNTAWQLRGAKNANKSVKQVVFNFNSNPPNGIQVRSNDYFKFMAQQHEFEYFSINYSSLTDRSIMKFPELEESLPRIINSNNFKTLSEFVKYRGDHYRGNGSGNAMLEIRI